MAVQIKTKRQSAHTYHSIEPGDVVMIQGAAHVRLRPTPIQERGGGERKVNSLRLSDASLLWYDWQTPVTLTTTVITVKES